MAQAVKCLPAVRETRVRSLGWEDPLEKEMAAHFSFLAWRIPWTVVHWIAKNLTGLKKKNLTGLRDFHFRVMQFLR